MRDLCYPNKTIRMSDKTWERLKEKRKKSGKTWNLYLLDLLKHYEQRKNKNDWTRSALPTLRNSSNKASSSEKATGWTEVLFRVLPAMSRMQEKLFSRITKNVLGRKIQIIGGIPSTFARGARGTTATWSQFSANNEQQRLGKPLSSPAAITLYNPCNTPLYVWAEKIYPRRVNQARNDV